LLALEDTENALAAAPSKKPRPRVEDQHLQQAATDRAKAAQLAARAFSRPVAADLFEVLDAERIQTRCQQEALGRCRSPQRDQLWSPCTQAMAGGGPSGGAHCMRARSDAD
jgi:hypothetical protein